ncbi:MAG: threonine synthase [Candidatus Anoxymicrobium japonicum]|uniref:Threonine synthase n=1 Tax=Candidatus Anoxymicrobium japonicum TaxID=2013648 RepID=A0A2N3G568_9ACTN|nr:MAG: threonine synthase [Candidatus Anoxymicrobium japonicum]
MNAQRRWRGVIEEYREYLPVGEATPVVTLLEGNTPLIRARNLSKRLDLEVHLKYEGVNPTGSFKDRGMTMAISKALEDGATTVICASTGNTSAAAAAYSAKAGINCVVLIPSGAIALGKLSQALMHGAQVLAVNGNFDDALRVVREIAGEHPVVLVNSVNPFRIEGQKTGAFEICDALGRPPDIHAIPVGNAGNITAYWKGYREYRDAGKIDALPRMLGFQAEGAAPIVRGRPIEKPETIATAIRIGNPASWKQAVAAANESGGSIDMVSDREILDAYQILAAQEGVFVEPASAASVAGLIKARESGLIESGLTAVCVLTGHGLKDPDRAIAESQTPPLIEPDADAIMQAIAAGRR